jgi:hypothetical protein
MWERTYRSKRLEIDWCEHQANIGFIEKYRHQFSGSDLKFFDDLF